MDEPLIALSDYFKDKSSLELLYMHLEAQRKILKLMEDNKNGRQQDTSR